MKHENDERIKQSTCPGCGQHLPHKGGLSIARFRIEKEDAASLNGLQPDSVLELASNALQFWVGQERTNAEYHRHQSKNFERRKDEMKEQFRQVHTEMQAQIASERQAKASSEARVEELKQEIALLQVRGARAVGL